MGWDVGTTGTNLGQLAICSWTFRQEETCALILASVTCEMGEAELGRLGPQQQRQAVTSKGVRPAPSALRTCRASEQQPELGLLEGSLVRKRENYIMVHGFPQSHTDTAVFVALGAASCIEQM